MWGRDSLVVEAIGYLDPAHLSRRSWVRISIRPSILTAHVCWWWINIIPGESSETDCRLEASWITILTQDDSGQRCGIHSKRHNRFTSCGPFPDGLLRLGQARLGWFPWCLEILPVACWCEEDVSRGRTGGLQGSFRNLEHAGRSTFKLILRECWWSRL
jgi:hypothetical protein